MGSERACEGCGANVALATIQLDTEGRQLCKRCHATALSAQADDVQRAHGARRACARCGQDTLVRDRPFAPAQLEGGGRDVPYTVGFHYRCSMCPHHVIIMSQGGFGLLAFVGALMAFMIPFGKTVENRWISYVFLGAIALALLREAYVRTRNPVRKT